MDWNDLFHGDYSLKQLQRVYSMLADQPELFMPNDVGQSVFQTSFACFTFTEAAMKHWMDNQS